MLNATGLYEPIVYDTQGLLDQGADVVVRVRHQGRLDREPELLGFQVKSFGDFRRRDLFRVLKAQRDDAFRKISGLSTYYLLLCTDEEKDKDSIRNIEAEFKGADRTIVIEPTFALGFLKLSERRIEGVVTRLDQADDIVFKRALETVDLGSTTAALLALYLAMLECEGRGQSSADEIRDKGILERHYEAPLESRKASAEKHKSVSTEKEDSRAMWERIRLKLPPTERHLERMTEVFFEDFSDALAYDLDLLDAHLIDFESSSGSVSVRRQEMLPLIALLTDAQVRYELSGEDLFLYGAEALGVADTESASW